MYKILNDAGTEGLYFTNDSFDTSEEALLYAMEYCNNFIIVKIIEFEEKEG